MGREIKFRAYVLTKAMPRTWRMIQAVAINWKRNWIEDDSGERHSIVGNKLCEFTGLKDKNGTEIYEGDVIHVTEIDHRGITEWKAPTQWIGAGWYLTYVNDTQCPLDCFGSPNEIGSLSELEVIGNIYENPELLQENTASEQ